MTARNPAWVPRLRALYTPVVADVLDKLGFRNQCPRADIRPLDPSMKLAGFALTVQTTPSREIVPPNPYEGELLAVDALQQDDVMVVSQGEWAFWGELLSTAARYRQAAGIVIDGFTRDTHAIIKMGFPVFCRGIHPADSLGRLEVIAHNVRIDCGGVVIDAGDLVLADYDGIVVIPSAIAEKTLELAEEKVRGENRVRQALENGMTTSEAFRTFGIL